MPVLGPPGAFELTVCLDCVKEARRAAIVLLLQNLHSIFRSCTADELPSGLQESCASTSLGTMIRKLSKDGFWPIPKDEAHVEISAQRLEQITTMLHKSIRDTLSRCTCRPFDRCSWWPYFSGLDEVRIALTDMIGGKFRTQFRTQAAKTGCEEWESEG